MNKQLVNTVGDGVSDKFGVIGRSDISSALSNRVTGWVAMARENGDSAHSLFQTCITSYLDFIYSGQFTVTKDPGHYLDEGMDYYYQLDIKIVDNTTNNPLFIEIKNQGDRGNAYERAMKVGPSGGLALLKQILYNVPYRPTMCVFSGDMINSSSPKSVKYKKTLKNCFVEFPDHLLFWDNYDPIIAINFVENNIIPVMRGRLSQRPIMEGIECSLVPRG